MLEIGLGHYLTIAAILFTLGLFGVFLNRKNIIIILMSIELMLLAVNINLVAFSAHLQDLVGQVFAMFVLTVAAAEAAIGLAILVTYYRNRGSIAALVTSKVFGSTAGSASSSAVRGDTRDKYAPVRLEATRQCFQFLYIRFLIVLLSKL